MSYRSTKLIDGFSTVFRQWKASTTHCSKLHGYALSFKVIFEGELDHRNWVVDFGGLKRASHQIDGMTPKDWFKYMFDHTVVLSVDDPSLDMFYQLQRDGVVQLRVVEEVGCEKFAEFVFKKLNDWVRRETDGKSEVVSVECIEHDKNSAIFMK